MSDISAPGTPLRLGIAGLGTVGIGVVKIIRRQAQLLEARAGRPVVISAVSARSKDKDRGVDLSDYAWEDDAVDLAKRDDVDVFVELMGGHEAPPKHPSKQQLRRAKMLSPPTRRCWRIMARNWRSPQKTQRSVCGSKQLWPGVSR